MKKALAVICIFTVSVFSLYGNLVYAQDVFTGGRYNTSYSSVNGDVTVEIIAVDITGRTDSVYATTYNNQTNPVTAISVQRWSEYSAAAWVIFKINCLSTSLSNYLVGPFTFELSIDNSDNYRVTEIYNMSNDGYISVNKTSQNNTFTIAPSADWGYTDQNANRRYVVTPGTSITVSAVIGFNTSYGSSNISMGSINGVTLLSTGYGLFTETDIYPNASHGDINNSLDEIIGLLTGDVPVNSDVTAGSSELNDNNDNVHAQEEAYYQANSQAIQATGLSNYQFDSSAVSGLTGVRGDFIDIWNSLGSWNSVYIFSLTLGLALTILRHSPSAISGALRRRRSNNE